jgi:uncharacterized SAM-binding protein YcdF (DUF218 family)
MSKFLFIISLMVLAVSCVYHPRTSRSLMNEPHAKRFDAVIVPGYPFSDGKWNWIMKGRIYWAKFLYDTGIAENIIFSGGAVYTPYIEAEIMAMYAEEIGIDRRHIFTETMAQHSTENVYYSYKKARKLGFKKIALASDPFQTKMLKGFIRKKLNDDVHILPFIPDTLKLLEPVMTDPEIDYNRAYVSNFRTLKKKQSWLERFRGTLGLQIDTTAYN